MQTVHPNTPSEAQDNHSAEPQPLPFPAARAPRPKDILLAPNGFQNHRDLLDTRESLLPALSPAHNCPPTVIEVTSPPARFQYCKSRRKGHVACLPKAQRDMVNRMLSNGLAYKNIIHALSECGFSLTEKNISNWANGGYLEWQAEQEFILQHHFEQDHLLDYLRREDATELPEVGLQAAATRISQLLLQKTPDQFASRPEVYARLVNTLCSVTREIAALQKQRDEARRSLGKHHNPVRIKDYDENTILDAERYASNPPKDSALAQPAQPPIVPPTPTADYLAQQDQEDEQDQRQRNAQKWLDIIRSSSGKTASEIAISSLAETAGLGKLHQKSSTDTNGNQRSPAANQVPPTLSETLSQTLSPTTGSQESPTDTNGHQR